MLDPGLCRIFWTSRLAGTCFSHGDDRRAGCNRASPSAHVWPLLISPSLMYHWPNLSHRAKPSVHRADMNFAAGWEALQSHKAKFTGKGGGKD